MLKCSVINHSVRPKMAELDQKCSIKCQCHLDFYVNLSAMLQLLTEQVEAEIVDK